MSGKLDEAIAELVEHEKYLHDHNYETWSLYHIPDYSADGNDMLELDRAMWGKGYFLRLISGGSLFMAIYVQDDTDYGFCDFSLAENEPLARALAAYKALTGEGWED